MFSSSAGGKKAPPQVRPPPACFRAPDVVYTDGRCRESRRWCKSVGHVPSPTQSITTLTLPSFESQTGLSMSGPLLSSVRVQWLTGILQRYLAVLEGPSSRRPAPEEDTRLEPRGWRLLFPRRHAQVGLPVWAPLWYRRTPSLTCLGISPTPALAHEPRQQRHRATNELPLRARPPERQAPRSAHHRSRPT